MFEINYKIYEYENSKLKEYEIYGEYGYFKIYVNDKSYGDMYEEKIEIFYADIYRWFYDILTGLLVLESNNYILVSDIDMRKKYIEFRRERKEVIVSIVEGDLWDGSGKSVETSKLKNQHYANNYWYDESIYFDEFKKKVLEKFKLYLKDLEDLNGLEKMNDKRRQRINGIKESIEKIEKISTIFN